MTVFAAPRNNFEATTDPTVSDDSTANYVSGSIWINQTNGTTWICVDGAEGAAIWSAGSTAGSVALGTTWKFDTTTTDSDPGSKTFRLNNATQASATFIYIDDIAQSGVDMRTLLLALKQNDRVYVQQSDDSTRYQLFLLSGDSVSATGYVKLPVTSEAGGTALQNNKACAIALAFTRTGSSSPTGAAGGDLADTYPNPSVAQASKSFALTGDITPTAIAGDTNDYSPTGLSTSAVLRISASTPGFNLTGLAGGADGRLLVIHNVGSFPIVFKDEDAGSTAANRFALTADMTMSTDSVAILQYDSTSSRWRAVSGGGGGGGGPTGAAGGDLSGTYPNPTVKQSSVAFALTGIITPTTIAADQNDYSPTGLSTSNTVRLSASTPGFALTGLAGGATGQLLIFKNVGTFPITLNDENAGSTAANRFALQDATDLTLNPDDGCLIQYDATASRWSVVGSSTISATTRLRVGPADATRPIPAGYFAAFRGGPTGNGLYIAAGEAEGDILIHIEDQDGTLTFAEVHADDGQWSLGATYAATLAARGFVHGMDNQWAASGLRQQDYNTQFGGYRTAGTLIIDNAGSVFATTLSITGVNSPAQITADQNNYAPAGLATAGTLRLNSDATRAITGLTGGASGRTMIVVNVGSFNIVLNNESASSTAANRFALDGCDLVLAAGHGAILVYDSTSTRWRGAAAATTCQLAGAVLLSGALSPTSIGADQNDYSPTGLATTSLLRLTASTPGFNVTGLTGGLSGRVITVHNIGSFNITLTNEGAGSTAANRFALRGAASLVVTPNKAVLLQYDATTARWRSLGSDDPTGVPGAISVATASAEGTAATLARSDHVHQSNTAPVDVTKAAAAIGTSGEPARADHKHDVTTAATNANPPGTASAEGTATSLARSDHAHGLAAFGSATGTFCEGNDPRLINGQHLLVDTENYEERPIVPGPQGNPGTTGAQGAVGPPVYLMAEQGDEGDRGAPGPTGPAGTNGAGAPGGATTQIQYNSAGVFAGSASLTWDNAAAEVGLNGDILQGVIAVPAAPAGSKVKIFAVTEAGRPVRATILPGGEVLRVQTRLDAPCAMWLPQTGTTLGLFGMGSTNSGTLSHPALAITNAMTAQRRTQFATSGTAGTFAGARGADRMVYRGDAATRGGFFFSCRFAMTTTLANARSFVGLNGSTSALTNVDPSGLATDICGVCLDSASANWTMITNDNAGACTTTDLGASYVKSATAMYELTMYCAPNAADIFWQIEIVGTATVSTGTFLNTNLPRTTIFLAPYIWITNNATASAAQIEMSRLYLETTAA